MMASVRLSSCVWPGEAEPGCREGVDAALAIECLLERYMEDGREDPLCWGVTACAVERYIEEGREDPLCWGDTDCPDRTMAEAIEARDRFASATSKLWLCDLPRGLG